MATQRPARSTTKAAIEEVFPTAQQQTAQPAAPIVAHPTSEPVTDVPFKDDEAETEDQALMRVLGSLGSDDEAKVLIYRQGPKYEDQTYIDECPPSEFTLSMLQDEPFNGGTFRIHVRGAGKSGFLANRKIKVQPKAVKTTTAPAVDTVTAALAQIQHKNEQFMEKMLAALQVPRQAPQQSPIDLLAQLKLLKDLMPAPAVAPNIDQMAMMKEAFALFKSMSEITGGSGGDGPDALTVIMRGIETFGKPIAEAIRQQQAAQGQPTQALEAPQQTAPVQPIQPQPEQDPMLMQKMQLKMYLGMLIDKASVDADPTGYAHLVVDNASDELIEEYLVSEGWLDRLAALDARVKNYPQWFDELRDMIFTLLTSDNTADTTEPSPGSSVQQNVPSSATDAKPDAPKDS